MSKRDPLKAIWKTKNFWLSVYWSRKDLAELSAGWWDKGRFAIRIWRLLVIYRPPKARVPCGDEIISPAGCAALTVGAAVVFAAVIVFLYHFDFISWKAAIGIAASGGIMGLVLGITVTILIWRAE